MRSERWLTRRAARGDREAFAAIFRRHQQDLYRYCVAILGDPDDAQDALQNTMVKALRALPGESREIALKPWLFRVAHNEAVELRRRARPTEPLADVELPAGASLEQVAAERGRLRELLNDLAALPERQRGALVMRELAGLDFAEIGAALETTPASARQVLYEARQGLREMGEGREMRCDAVTAVLSDGDGRVARRRDIRAHLRGCSDCRGFADEIQVRGQTLAAIAPLPALAAAAMLKTALATSAGGAAATGATAAGGAAAGGGGSAGAGSLGLAVASKVGSTATVVKSALGVVAIVAVGAVAADRAHLVDPGGSGADAPANKSTDTAGDVSTAERGGADREGAAASGGARDGERSLRVREARVTFERRPGLDAARPNRRGAGPTGGTDRARPEDAEAAPSHQAVGLVPAAGESTAAPTPEGGRTHAAEKSASGAGTVHPEHPDHPSHPTRPAPKSGAAPPGHPDHPSHPDRPEHPSHPTTPSHPEAAPPTTPPESKSRPDKEAKAGQGTEVDEPPAPPADAAAEPSPDEGDAGRSQKDAVEEEGEARSSRRSVR